MDDPEWYVVFNSEPIRVHARDSKQAVEVAIEFMRQPETTRIIVTPRIKNKEATT